MHSKKKLANLLLKFSRISYKSGENSRNRLFFFLSHYRTFELDTQNPPRLISIFTMGSGHFWILRRICFIFWISVINICSRIGWTQNFLAVWQWQTGLNKMSHCLNALFTFTKQNLYLDPHHWKSIFYSFSKKWQYKKIHENFIFIVRVG